MKIIIETIPHEEQRYSTCGDWYFTEEFPPTNPPQGSLIVPADFPTLHIKVSKLSDWRREALVAVHELFEVLLCKHEGITQESVDLFDKQFESTRAPDNFDEPGDDPSAPYVKQHCTASGIERLLAAQLGVSWKEYEAELERLP
jgi:hypothetical protein